MKARLGRLSGLSAERIRELAIPFICLGLFLLLAITIPTFFTQENLLNIADQWAPTLIVACGATFVIIARGFDLSAGAVFGVSGVLAVSVANEHGAVAALVVAVAMGVVVGLVNGIVTTALKVHSFLVTLATSLIVAGLGLAFSSSTSVIATNDGFRAIARDELFGARYPIFIALAVLIVLQVVMSRTYYGEQLFGVGGDPEAARASGIRVTLVRISTFVLSGGLAGLAGVIGAARASSGQLTAGTGLEFTAITAVILGGTSLFGGRGSVVRTLLGVALLGMIGNGVNLSDINVVYQQVIVGALLLIVIAIEARSRKS